MRYPLFGAMLLTAYAGGVGPSCQHAGRSAAMDESRRHDDDLKAIQQLHEADKRATLALHVDALLDLWADDGVMLRPGSAPIVGKEAIKEVLRRWNPDPDQVEPLRADIDFQDVKIIGDWAIEYGTFDSAWHVSGEEAPVTSVGNILRVLKRQPDGSWKCARAIWNTNADAQQ